MNDESKPKSPPVKISACLDMEFPEPTEPLLEGPGEPCTWEECMRETALQTRHWLENFGPDLSPPPFEDRFSFDD